MNLSKIAVLLLLTAPGWATAQDRFPVSELSIDGIYGTRGGDPTAYCLLGGNACILPGVHDAWTDDPILRSWLAQHPKAMAFPVSTRTWPIAEDTTRLHAYLWIEDGRESLNVELVREGRYPADLMEDMVEDDRRLAELIHGLPTRQSEGPPMNEPLDIPDKDRPRRLVSDDAYAAMMNRISEAGAQAQRSKKGMWSDAGLKGRSPPTDEYLIGEYRHHKHWFDRIRTLLTEEPRLADVNQDAMTWETAREAGVDRRKLKEYVGLLSNLDANEQLTGVHGIGQVCLVVADILTGLFDNGIIEGYVYAPSDPRPLVGVLGDDSDESRMAYRAVGGNWFLFRFYH
jgi:hypothetical protein